jgi:hypothetical protein
MSFKIENDCHARDSGIFGRSDRKRINVVTATGKESGHTGKDAGAIFDEY